MKENNKNFVYKKLDMYTSLLNFKAFVEGNVYPVFRVTQNPIEEIGRSLLQAYLYPRGFREAQMTGGNSDLVYPTEETIIETKIWRDQERYQDGLVELSSYLKSQEYKIGYYVIFDNTQKDNSIVVSKGTDIFNVIQGNHLIHCFFIKINPVAPSKKRRAKDTK